MSATFSANAGSLLTLNVPARCGFTPCSRHSFATKWCDTYTPSVRLMKAAISRLDQCDSPVPAGGLIRVAAKIRHESAQGPAHEVPREIGQLIRRVLRPHNGPATDPPSDAIPPPTQRSASSIGLPRATTPPAPRPPPVLEHQPSSPQPATRPAGL